jgi:hypothetical protein
MIDLVADLNAFDEERLNAGPLTCELLAKRAASRISALEAEKARLREALKFYAKATYSANADQTGHAFGEYRSAQCWDCGDIARAALGDDHD